MIKGYFKFFVFLAITSFVFSSCSDDSKGKSDKKDFSVGGIYFDGDDKLYAIGQANVSKGVKGETKTLSVFIRPLEGKFENLSHAAKLKKAKLELVVSHKATLSYGGNNINPSKFPLDISDESKTFKFKVNAEDGSSVDYEVKFKYFLFSKNEGEYEPVDLKKVTYNEGSTESTVDLSSSVDFGLKLSIDNKLDKKVAFDFNFYRADVDKNHKDWIMFSYSFTKTMTSNGGKWVVSDLGLTKAEKSMRKFEITAGDKNKETPVSIINDHIPNFVKELVAKKMDVSAVLEKVKEKEKDIWKVKKSAETLVNSWGSKKFAYEIVFAKAEDDKKSPEGAPTDKYQGYAYLDGDKYKVRVKIPIFIKGILFGDLSIQPIKSYLTMDAVKKMKKK